MGWLDRLSRLPKNRRRLLKAQDFAVNVNHDAEAHHAEIAARFFGDAGLEEGVELVFDILKLFLDDGTRENIVLSEHFGSLLAENILVTFNHLRHLRQNLTVNPLRGDVTQKAVIIHHVARLRADERIGDGTVVFVHDETEEKRFVVHV